MTITAKIARTEKVRRHAELLWNELRERMSARRIMVGDENINLLKVRGAEIADELHISQSEVSVALRCLEGYGYLVRDGRSYRGSDIRIKSMDDYDPDNPPAPWREPHKAYTRKSESYTPPVRVTAQPVASVETAAVDDEPIDDVVQIEVPKVMVPRHVTRVVLPDLGELGVAILQQILARAIAEPEDRSTVQSLQDQIGTLEADVITWRSRANQYEREVRRLQEENSQYLDMADHATKSVDGLKKFACEAKDRLKTLAPESLKGLPGTWDGIIRQSLDTAGWDADKDYEYVVGRLEFITDGKL